MKRIVAVAFLFVLLVVPAFAYMSSGKIDGELGWSFRDLSINNNQVSVAMGSEIPKRGVGRSPTRGLIRDAGTAVLLGPGLFLS